MGVAPPLPFALDPRFHINIRSAIGILVYDTKKVFVNSTKTHANTVS